MSDKKKSELEAKIREAVPESMKCLLIGIGPNEICHYCRAIDGGVDGCSTGRPLGLADVLIALNKTEQVKGVPTFIASNGGFYDNGTLICQYDLTKDYHHQSEEFYEFLHSLLL